MSDWTRIPPEQVPAPEPMSSDEVDTLKRFGLDRPADDER